MASLQAKLDAIRKAFEAEAPAEALEVLHRAAREREAVPLRGVGEGDPLPDFELPDSRGETVHSSELVARGPLVLTFFRGHW